MRRCLLGGPPRTAGCRRRRQRSHTERGCLRSCGPACDSRRTPLTADVGRSARPSEPPPGKTALLPARRLAQPDPATRRETHRLRSSPGFASRTGGQPASPDTHPRPHRDRSTRRTVDPSRRGPCPCHDTESLTCQICRHRVLQSASAAARMQASCRHGTRPR